MTNDVMIVDCGRCRKHFEMPLSLIKSIDEYGDPVLFEKYRCPLCNKNHKIYFDPSVDPIEAREKVRLKREEEKRRKAALSFCCPLCKSTQLHASDKGFSTGKALVGSVFASGIGLLAGFHGSKQVMLSCLSCGHRWKLEN